MADMMLRSAIASVIPRPLLKALYSPDGAAAYSSTSYCKLQAAGLIDGSHRWTAKGIALRIALNIEVPTP